MEKLLLENNKPEEINYNELYNLEAPNECSWEEFYEKSSELLDESFESEEKLKAYQSFVEEFKKKADTDEELSEKLDVLLSEEMEFFNKDDNPLYEEHRNWISTLYESCNEIDLTEVFEASIDITEEDKEFNEELEELMQYSTDITLPDEVVLETNN